MHNNIIGSNDKNDHPNKKKSIAIMTTNAMLAIKAVKVIVSLTCRQSNTNSKTINGSSINNNNKTTVATIITRRDANLQYEQSYR